MRIVYHLARPYVHLHSGSSCNNQHPRSAAAITWLLPAHSSSSLEQLRQAARQLFDSSLFEEPSPSHSRCRISSFDDGLPFCISRPAPAVFGLQTALPLPVLCSAHRIQFCTLPHCSGFPGISLVGANGLYWVMKWLPLASGASFMSPYSRPFPISCFFLAGFVFALIM